MKSSIYIRVGKVAEVTVPYVRACDPQKIVDLLGDKADSDRETFFLVLMSSKNDVLGVEIHSLGSINYSMIYIREVVKSVVLRNAAGLVVVHNHPSGDPEPSGEDCNITRTIAAAMKLIECKLLDHIIIGAARNGLRAFYSFASHGREELNYKMPQGF